MSKVTQWINEFRNKLIGTQENRRAVREAIDRLNDLDCCQDENCPTYVRLNNEAHDAIDNVPPLGCTFIMIGVC